MSKATPARKKSKKKLWFFGALFGIIVIGLIAVGQRSGPQGIEVVFGKASKGDITATVSATGTVRPEVTVTISSEVPGEIVELPLKDGDPVQRGDLLVRVNPDTLEAQVKQQEASLASRKAFAAQSRAELLKAELDLQRVVDLNAKGFATTEQLDQAKTSLEVRKAAYEASLHEIERQEMLLKEASDLLGKASTFSPIDGNVIGVFAELGDRVVGTGQFAGTSILRVADLSNMEVIVDVSEADIVNIEIGQTASIEVDAFPKRTFTGTVSEIANSAETSGSGSQEQLTTFSVKIRLDPTDVQLRPGMTATAEIETDEVTDAVRVPIGAVVVRPAREVRRALQGDAEDKTAGAEAGDAPASRPGERGYNANAAREDRVRIVFVRNGDSAELRKVETGIADANFMQILSGIEPGEELITGPYSALTRDLEHQSAISERQRSDDRKGQGPR